MKSFLNIFLIILSIQAYAQFDALPIYQLKPLSEINLDDHNLFSALKLKGDSISLLIGSQNQVFTAKNTASLPVLLSDASEGSYYEILEWELVSYDQVAVTFDVHYAKKDKDTGKRIGKFGVIMTQTINRNQIEGAYIGQIEEKTSQKAKWISLGAAGAILILILIAI